MATNNATPSATSPPKVNLNALQHEILNLPPPDQLMAWVQALPIQRAIQNPWPCYSPLRTLLSYPLYTMPPPLQWLISPSTWMNSTKPSLTPNKSSKCSVHHGWHHHHQSLHPSLPPSNHQCYPTLPTSQLMAQPSTSTAAFFDNILDAITTATHPLSKPPSDTTLLILDLSYPLLVSQISLSATHAKSDPICPIANLRCAPNMTYPRHPICKHSVPMA